MKEETHELRFIFEIDTSCKKKKHFLYSGFTALNLLCSTRDSPVELSLPFVDDLVDLLCLKLSGDIAVHNIASAATSLR